MDVVIRFMHRHSTGRVILVLFTLTMAVYSTMLLYSIPLVSAFAPDRLLFDLSPAGYSFTYANELLTALGEEGRDAYLFTQLPLDFIYPGLFSITYSLMLVWLFAKTCKVESTIYYFALVPFVAGIFDYIENVFIISMINSFPELQIHIVKVASTFTLLKSSFTLCFFILLMVGFAMLCKQRLMNRPD
tara:strand:+ start:548 stop:1111 length:564 start_codon:yes stop_codon:yes gene_type:complete